MLRSKEFVLYEAAMFIPPGGRRGRGRPRRRYVDTSKIDVANRNINLNTTTDQFWENLRLIAANRTEWNSIVKREEARIDYYSLMYFIILPRKLKLNIRLVPFNLRKLMKNSMKLKQMN